MMGDFNGKVGENREEDTIWPFGVGVRNDNGERVVNFCTRHNLFATNTWFQQRKSAQHTWISPDKVTKNQIDFVLVDKRFRNGILNSKSMPGADCDSDHNPVVVKMKIRLQRVKKAKKTVKWNVNNLKKSEVRNAYRMRLDQQLQEEKIDGCMEVDEIWKRLKDGISTVAEEICGKEMQPKKQNWFFSLFSLWQFIFTTFFEFLLLRIISLLMDDDGTLCLQGFFLFFHHLLLKVLILIS